MLRPCPSSEHIYAIPQRSVQSQALLSNPPAYGCELAELQQSATLCQRQHAGSRHCPPSEGRLLAEATAGIEMLQRARDAAILAQSQLPGSAFALGIGKRLGEVSIEALFEREQHMTEAANQIAAKSD